MPKNGEDWGKLIVAKGFKKLRKVQKIANSGHTDSKQCNANLTELGYQKGIVFVTNWDEHFLYSSTRYHRKIVMTAIEF